MSGPSREVHTSGDAPDGWDDFVARAPGGSFCHLAGWKDVFGDAFGHEHVFAWTMDDGEMDAVLPLVRMPTLRPGRALVSVPYLNYGGPIGSETGVQALAAWSAEEARRIGAKMLELRNRGGAPGELGPGRKKVTVVMDLPDEADTLWSDGFRSKLRSQIKRPMKEGMETFFGPDRLDDFYEVFRVNMRDLGTPVHPRRLFESIAREFASIAEFGVVYHEGRPVAAGCGFVFGGEFEITWASSLREFNRLSPNMLLYWAFMQRAIERGAGVFNFGRCTPGGGTHRFKLQWGSRDEPLHWTGRPARGEDEPGSGGTGLAQRIWSRLPLGVAQIIGPRLARRLPEF